MKTAPRPLNDLVCPTKSLVGHIVPPQLVVNFFSSNFDGFGLPAAILKTDVDSLNTRLTFTLAYLFEALKDNLFLMNEYKFYYQ